MIFVQPRQIRVHLSLHFGIHRPALGLISLDELLEFQAPNMPRHRFRNERAEVLAGECPRLTLELSSMVTALFTVVIPTIIPRATHDLNSGTHLHGAAPCVDTPRERVCV